MGPGLLFLLFWPAHEIPADGVSHAPPTPRAFRATPDALVPMLRCYGAIALTLSAHSIVCPAEHTG